MSERDQGTREARRRWSASGGIRRPWAPRRLRAWAGGRGDHFGAKDAVGAGEGGGTDPIELWGRRIGRALSLVGVVVLAIWLLVQLRIL